MGSSRTVRIVLAFAVLLLSVGAAQSALAAETVKVDTKIRFGRGAPLQGKLKSDKNACVQSRLVKLYRKRQNGGKKLVAKTRSKQNGNWREEFNVTAGTYVAHVEKLRVHKARKVLVCRPAKNKFILH